MIRILLSMMMFLVFSQQEAIASTSLEKQRQQFSEAKAALEAGEMDRFQTLKTKLKRYPLTPYLDLWQASQHIDHGYDIQVQNILARHESIPEAVDLQIEYVKNLAQRGQWPHVALALDKLRAADRLLPEISMLTLWYTNRKDEALDRFSERWQRGIDSSDISFRIEQKWRSLGHPTRIERWKRIGTFVRQGNWDEVKALEKGLGRNDRMWLARWEKMQQDPLAVLSTWNTDQHHIATMAMIHDGLKRLSRYDAASAWRVLQHLKPLFADDLLIKYRRRIALLAATEQVENAALWLSELPESLQDKKTRSWMIRIHLLYDQWDEALKAIQQLPENERNESRWSYWQARALAALGRPDEAQKQFEKTAQGRGYYSFLSAERSGLPYRMGASDLDVNRSELTSLKREEGIKRAHEWWLLGDGQRASREWGNVLSGASPERWRAAAVLASQWQQHNHVIQAAYLAGEINALDQRFPIAFNDEVTTTAAESGLSTSLIWSIIRQESAFNAYAVSRTGAKGLMQLMPATASEVVKENNLSKDGYDLFDPATNIRLGGLYLSQMVERFNHNRALAAAAYNAGPHRVSEWLEQRPFIEPDIWIETIPYHETRRYVQQVMAFMVVYDWRQQKKPAGIISQLQNLDVALDSEGDRDAL